MKDQALKKITDDLAAELRSWLELPDTKAAIAETRSAPDSDAGTFEAIITTENLDRYQEVISLEGWELEHYRSNPVVLWGHDHHQLPIGIATSIDVVDGKMVAKGKFAPHPFAQQIRQLYDLGVVRATSVGFIEKEREGNLITKAELLEFSFVSVPANPYALSTLVKSGVSVNDMVTKGIMFVEKDADATIPEEKVEKQNEKGAVAEEAAAEKARQEKWRNFSKVDDVIYSFFKVYMDSDTPVADFTKLLDETIALLKQVAGGKKELVFGDTIKELDSVDMQKVRENVSAFTAVGPDQIKAMIVALEALSEKDGEPEGNEAPVEATEEEKAFAEFSAKRKLLQDASTVIGDVLAEARRAMEAM